MSDVNNTKHQRNLPKAPKESLWDMALPLSGNVTIGLPAVYSPEEGRQGIL